MASFDIRHQLQVMQLVRPFARAGGGAAVVMHDLNLAAMIADAVVLLRDGRVAARGTPGEVLRDGIVSAAYGCTLRVSTQPPGAEPYLLPQAATLDHACANAAFIAAE